MSTLTNTDLQRVLKERVATYPDFPKPGVNFKDIQSILSSPQISREVLLNSYEVILKNNPSLDAIVGFDARGFLFGTSLAIEFDIPFILARKANKLPGELVTVSFEKEYGPDTLSVQKGLIVPGMKVLIHDDLLATGGTALAAVDLVKKEGGIVSGFHFIIELGYLGGREKIEQHGKVLSMVRYETSEE